MNNPGWLVLLSILATGCSERVESVEALVARAEAPLFEGLGDYHRSITTRHPGAQRYFNQGMVLAFGFNHAESIRSFRAAQRLDDQCAMCYWGEALATGPNINVTSKGKAIMSPEERTVAYAAVQKAVGLKRNATALERDLIDVLATRYDGDPETERDPLDHAYAEALGRLVQQYPDDDDVAAMFAEAWMNTMPWNYWSVDGHPKPETVKVIDALEEILERSPDHPLALHLYIHAVEASSNPGRLKKRRIGWPTWCPVPDIWSICQPISIGVWVDTMTRQRPMCERPLWMRNTSLNATLRAFTLLSTIRTTFTFFGRRPAWRVAVRWPSMPHARWQRRCG